MLYPFALITVFTSIELMFYVEGLFLTTSWQNHKSNHSFFNNNNRIYERFKADCIAHTVFLECLEPYILDERLKTLSPLVMQDFVKHYEAKSMCYIIF